MRRALYFIVSAFVILSFTGCKVEDSNAGFVNASRGMLDGWQQSVMEMDKMILEPVFHFNAWYSAPDSLRDQIEDKYFPYQKIRQIGDNTWAIMHGQVQELLIETNGETLASDAHWMITYSNHEFVYGFYGYWNESFTGDDRQIEIQTIQPYTWNITVNTKGTSGSVDSDEAFEPYAQLTLSFSDMADFDGVFPESINVPYTLSGQGRFKFRNEYIWDEEERLTEDDYTYLDFNIEEPLVNDTRYGFSANWAQGVLLLRAFNAAGTERMVKASFDKDDERYRVDLEYHGGTTGGGPISH